MANLRSKGKDVVLEVVVDGKLLPSLIKVTNFSHKPLVDIVDTAFLGSPASDFDHDFKGHQVDFTIQEIDSAGIDGFLIPTLNALQAGTPPPRVDIIATTSYRGLAIAPVTDEFKGVVLVVNERSAGSASDYVGLTFTGKTPTWQRV